MSGRQRRVERSVMLFTRGLRVHDNPALAAAAGAGEVIPLFVLDPVLLEGRSKSPNRARFLAESLLDLDRALRSRGGRLVLRSGDPVEEAVCVVRQWGASKLHLARDVSAYAGRRRQRLEAPCRATGCAVLEHAGISIVPAGSVLPGGGGDHFKVLTPYWRAWQSTIHRPELPAPRRLHVPEQLGSQGGLEQLPQPTTACSPRLPRGGEAAGRRRLDAWLRQDGDRYAALHDAMADDATSRLSPYLHFGSLSPGEVARRVERRGGGEAFLRQLCWRDFYQQVLAAPPDLPTRDYRGRGGRWREDPASLAAWREGRTGCPVVDAGMRQLRREGWMHNRARLLVASFLVKDLGIDWRLGAAHFFEWLVDGDAANNAGNWQWVAGTGNDPRPNRVFNPLRQALRFDPRGDYVRRYIPELREVEGPAVHEPWRLPAEERKRLAYPNRIVNHDAAAHAFRRERGGHFGGQGVAASEERCEMNQRGQAGGERATNVVEMNSPVVERLLREPAQTLVEGGLVLRVVETHGRQSGKVRRTPLGVVRQEGHSYLISPQPARAWVRNLDANPECALLGGGRREECRAVRATPDQAVEAALLYLDVVRAPWAREAFPFPPGAPPETVHDRLDRVAVFRLVGAEIAPWDDAA